MSEAEAEEENPTVKAEKAYLDDLPFTLQDSMDSVAQMTSLLQDENSEFSQRLNKIAQTENNIERLHEKMVPVLEVLSALRKNVMRVYVNKGVVSLGRAAGMRSKEMTELDLLEQKFRYLIGQHSRKDKKLRQAVKDMYKFVAQRVFGVELHEYENFLSEDRAIAVYIIADHKTQLHMSDAAFLEQILSKYNIEDINVQKNPAMHRKYMVEEYVPILYTYEMHQLMFEESIQSQLHEEREKPVKLSDVEGYVNYKFALAEAMFRGRMDTSDQQQQKMQQQQQQQ